MRHITHVNESHHKSTKRQRSRRWCVWMSHVSHMTVSRHTWMSHVAHTRMSHVAHARMSHVTRRHASYSETIGASAPRIVLDFGYFKKKTCVFGKRHLKETHWLAMMMHMLNWDVSIWKKTCTFKKIRMCWERDISNRPTDLRWWCICQIQTYLYEGNLSVFDNKSIYMKKETYIYGKETYVFGKGRLEETYWLAMMMHMSNWDVSGNPCVFDNKSIYMKRDVYIWKRDVCVWKETSQRDPLTRNDDACVCSQ